MMNIHSLLCDVFYARVGCSIFLWEARALLCIHNRYADWITVRVHLLQWWYRLLCWQLLTSASQGWTIGLYCDNSENMIRILSKIWWHKYYILKMMFKSIMITDKEHIAVISRHMSWCDSETLGVVPLGPEAWHWCLCGIKVIGEQ